jgi:hypothetical protein
MAASATFALKAGVWFRRARLLIVSPDSRVNLARRQAETPLIPLFRFLRPALVKFHSVMLAPPICRRVSVPAQGWGLWAMYQFEFFLA